MGARPADKDTAAAADCDGPAVGDYDVVDTSGMAVSGPAWTMGSKIAAAGEVRDAADLPGGLASMQHPCSNEELSARVL
jgi:hypothetical protein